jgi:dienelactone hydrolase
LKLGKGRETRQNWSGLDRDAHYGFEKRAFRLSPACFPCGPVIPWRSRSFRVELFAKVVVMRGFRLVVASLLIFGTASRAIGADGPGDFVEEILKRPIIGGDLGLAEVRLFAEAKVPRMPEAKDLPTWQALADKMRRETLDNVVYRGEAKKWRQAPTRLEWQETIDGGPGYRIKKLRYEIAPGFWMPALLYEPEKLEGKIPAVLNFNGHDPNGMFADYKQIRCINLAKRGLIALNVDWIGMGQLKNAENQHTLLNHLDLCGTSGLAVFASLQTRGVDVLLSHPNVDPARIAATGLSGGGWQTIFLGSMDPRVSLTVPVAGYSSFLTRAHFPTDLGDSEQTPVDLATVTDYALMTAMLAPRAALLTFNAKDNCCFAADHALTPLLDAAMPIYRLYGQEKKLRTHVNHDPGTHNYLKDNRQALYRMIGDEFFAGQADFPGDEIPSDAEIKTADQLRVALPDDQATLHSLAMALSKDLPRDPTLPTGKDAALMWQVARRMNLMKIVHFHDYQTKAELISTEMKDGITAKSWKIRLDDVWTIPAVEFFRGEPKDSTIVIADLGKKEAKAAILELLERGRRVVAVDLFDTGESTISDKAWLWNLYVSTVGERPLGLKASELAAISRWLNATSKIPPSVLAIGPGSSIVGLVVAGLEPTSVGELELRESPASLKEPIEATLRFEKAPDRFCFGLLEAFDVPQLVALVAPRRVVFANPTNRMKAGMAPLKTWYSTLGRELDPAGVNSSHQ